MLDWKDGKMVGLELLEGPRFSAPTYWPGQSARDRRGWDGRQHLTWLQLDDSGYRGIIAATEPEHTLTSVVAGES